MNASRRFHPSIPAISFVIWLVVASVVFPDRMINADGDMLRHITHGAWMLEHGRLITADPFSFTRPGDAFVAFEYGSQLIYAAAYAVGGIPAVAFLAGLLIATAYALIARFLLRRGVDALLAYLASVGAALLGAVHWVARPHLFTLLMVALLLPVLEPRDSERPRWRGYLLVGGLFALWANLHGGFAFGLAVLVVYAAGSALELLLSSDDRREEWRQRLVWYAGAFGAGLVGSLLTPHGIALHQHIVYHFQLGYLLDHTQEFLSPDFHTIVGKLFLVGLLGTAATLALVPRRPDWRRLLLILALSYLALTARRNIQLFGALVVPILALHADFAWRMLPDWRGIRAVFDRDARGARTLPYILPVVLAFTALVSLGGRLGSIQVIPAAVSSSEFPVDLVRAAREDGRTGRMFHDFIWGGFLLHEWPEQKVFIDGGTDFYGEELMYAYINTSERGRGWRDTLDSYRIDRVLVPTNSVFVEELLHDPSWSIWRCDSLATLAERDASGIPAPGTERSLVIRPDPTLAACRE